MVGVPTGAVDVWLEDLSADDALYAYFWEILDTDEKTKAMRFVHETHRRQYIISHGKLRAILASYLGMAPATISFTIAAYGKPHLTGKAAALKFNLSHSGNKMAVAVGGYDYLGVDIEAWNSGMDLSGAAKTCFGDSEQATWHTATGQEKLAVFYQLWTRKESFLKAVGMGMTLEAAKVITATEGEPRFLSLPEGYPTHEWKLIDLKFGHGLSAALTVKAPNHPPINLKQWVKP